MIGRLIAVMVVLALMVPAAVQAQDGAQTETFIVWTVAGTTDQMIQIASDIQAAGLALDYVDHVEMEWYDPPSMYTRVMQVRIYFAALYDSINVYWDVMRELVVLFPERWGHIAPYLPGAN